MTCEYRENVLTRHLIQDADTGVAFVNSAALASQVLNTTKGIRIHCIQRWPGRAQGNQSKVSQELPFRVGN